MTTLINLRVLAGNVLNDVNAFGGSTQSAIAGVPTTASGYAVSLPGHERRLQRFKGGQVSLNFIEHYAEQHRAVLAQPGRFLGAWLDEGTLYLDVTEVHAEFATAVRLGWERNQLAIYNIGTGEEIKTRPGRRVTLTAEQSNADKLAHETGLVRDYFQRIGNTHGNIMASVTGPESPSPFDVVAGAIAELGDDGELRLLPAE